VEVVADVRTDHPISAETRVRMVVATVVARSVRLVCGAVFRDLESRMILQPGIHFGVATADYFADPAPTPSLTQSIAKILLDESPAHARLAHPRLAPPVSEDDDETEKYVAAQAIGNAAHKLLIGRGKELALADFENWRKKEAQQFKESANLAGLTPILSAHYDRAQQMAKTARVQLDAIGWTDAFAWGEGETVLIAKDGDTYLRTMVDWYVDPTLCYDLKTSGGSLAPHLIGRKAEADGWHIQAAMQERILDILEPESAGRHRWRCVAQENWEPWALVAVELDERWLTMGRKALAMAVGIWRQCMASGQWPAYPAFPITPEFPSYKEAAWLGRELAHENRRIAADHLMGG